MATNVNKIYHSTLQMPRSYNPLITAKILEKVTTDNPVSYLAATFGGGAKTETRTATRCPETLSATC